MIRGNYRKQPVVIQCLEWTGVNLGEVKKFTGDSFFLDYSKAVFKGGFWENIEVKIITLEGVSFNLRVGDVIIRGVQGEHYACKPDIFKLTYERVESEVVT